MSAEGRRWWQFGRSPAPEIEPARRSGVLNSRVEGAPFQATSTVWLANVDESSRSTWHLHVLAGREVWRQAHELTRKHLVMDCDMAEAELNLYFAYPTPVGDEGVTATAAFQLAAPEAAVRITAAYQDAEGQGAIAQLKYQQQLRQARAVRDTVLADPSLARAWWLDGKPDRLQNLALVDQALHASTVEGGPSSPTRRSPVADIAERFLAGLKDEERSYFLRVFGTSLESFDRLELADELRRATSPSARPHGSATGTDTATG